MKVLIVIITADDVMPECLASVRSQTHADTSWLIHGQRPQHDHPNPLIRTYLNCAANREAARRIALASDADAFLFLDSDIVIPPAAVAEFVSQAGTNKDIIGGWYKMRHGDRWVAASWVADNVVCNARAPAPSVTKVDMTGLGCTFITRTALERVPFRHGTDTVCKEVAGYDLILGECGAFGNDAADAGFTLWMTGDVTCQHLERGAAA